MHYSKDAAKFAASFFLLFKYCSVNLKKFCKGIFYINICKILKIKIWEHKSYVTGKTFGNYYGRQRPLGN